MKKMKESGVDWIGEIPERWKLRRGKNLYKIDTGKLDANAENPDGRYPFFTCSMFPKKINTYDFNCEALMVAGNGIVGFTQYYKGKFNAYQRTYVLYDFRDVNPHFLKYYVSNNLSIEVAPNSVGSVIQFIKLGDLQNFHIVLPDGIEQEKIVDFLNEKVVEIDKAIEKTKENIEEYKKYKQAIITESITKGIKKQRTLKDSSNIYIGKIPNNWNMKKIKYIFYIKKNIAGKEGYNVLSITQKGIRIKDLSNNDGQMASNYSNYQMVNKEDFAMNHMDLLTGWVDVSEYEGVTSPDYRVFSFIDRTKYSIKYYLYLMQMCYMNKIFYGLGQGVSNLGRWRLQSYEFLNFTVPVPELKEQIEIANYLDKKCKIIDKVITNKERLIKELENYKKSLIYEYVTGKKEVKSNKSLSKDNSKGIKINCKDNIFAQAILLCKIIEKLNNYNLGRIKAEKTLYLIEKEVGFDFDNNYAREAAGPLSEAIYKCEAVISKSNKWVKVNKVKKHIEYEILSDFNKYNQYYNKYYSGYDDEIEKVIEIIKNCSTDKAEMIATLYASWNDFIIKKEKTSNLKIVKDVRENWNDRKKRFKEKEWLNVLDEMKQIGLVPKGNGNLTIIKEQ